MTADRTDAAFVAWETDLRCDEVGDDWGWLVDEACVDAAAIGTILWSRYRVADARWRITPGGLELRCRLGRADADDLQIELCLIGAHESETSVFSRHETHSWYVRALAGDAAEHARAVDAQLSRCVGACRVAPEASGDRLAEAFAPVVRELQAAVGRAGMVRTWGFDGGAGGWSTNDAPAYGIELEPASARAAPVAFAFDAEDVVHVTVGRQGACFEDRHGSLEEALASMRRVATAVVAGRYRERASVTRVLRRPRLTLEFADVNANTFLATHSSLQRATPDVDRTYAPYR